MKSLKKLYQKMGHDVISIHGVDWYEYSKKMYFPAYLPFEQPSINSIQAENCMRSSKALILRWDTDIGDNQYHEWWYVVLRRPYTLENMPKKKRYIIRKCRELFTTRLLTSEEISTKCLEVARKANLNYSHPTDSQNTEVYYIKGQCVLDYPQNYNIIGCFINEELVGFSENIILGNSVWFKTIKSDPNYLSSNSNYALVDGIIRYFRANGVINIIDGSRSLLHGAAFQHILISTFGFERVFMKMNLVYNSKFRSAFPLFTLMHKILSRFHLLVEKDVRNKLTAIVTQDQIFNTCKRKS